MESTYFHLSFLLFVVAATQSKFRPYKCNPDAIKKISKNKVTSLVDFYRGSLARHPPPNNAVHSNYKEEGVRSAIVPINMQDLIGNGNEGKITRVR